MEIRINHNWRITSDTYNIKLEKRRIVTKGREKGKEAWCCDWFYGTIEQALNGYLGQIVRDCDAETFDELKELLENTKSEIAEAARTLEASTAMD